MKRNRIFSGIIIVSVLITLSCNTPPPETFVNYMEKDTLNFEIIADTITYDVIIKNTVKTDPMTDEFLRYLNKTGMIDGIFTSIYSGKLVAYDYFSGEKLNITAVKEMENIESFSRDDIGKIQFAEVWYYNADHSVFKKKVVSMVLGLEQFNDDGTLRGYKPIFKIYLN